MGWGLDSWWDQIENWVTNQGSDRGTQIISQEAQNELLTRIVVDFATDYYDFDLPELMPYTGGSYMPLMVGWPICVGVEAFGSTGVLPTGTFFIGHATPGMIMETFRMTQSGIATELNYEIRSGFIARLIQKTPSGEILFVNGHEIGVDRDGRIVREDLTLAAKSPLQAEVRYGGPIEPYLPLYIDITTYGDFADVPGVIDDLQVQATATFLCQEVNPDARLVPATGSGGSEPPQDPELVYKTKDPRKSAPGDNKARRR